MGKLLLVIGIVIEVLGIITLGLWFVLPQQTPEDTNYFQGSTINDPNTTLRSGMDLDADTTYWIVMRSGDLGRNDPIPTVSVAGADVIQDGERNEQCAAGGACWVEIARLTTNSSGLHEFTVSNNAEVYVVDNFEGWNRQVPVLITWISLLIIGGTLQVLWFVRRGNNGAAATPRS